MGFGTKDDGWRISDELWSKMEPLLPKPKPHPLGCHRPRVRFRRILVRWEKLAGTYPAMLHLACALITGALSVYRNRL